MLTFTELVRLLDYVDSSLDYHVASLFSLVLLDIKPNPKQLLELYQLAHNKQMVGTCQELQSSLEYEQLVKCLVDGRDCGEGFVFTIERLLPILLKISWHCNTSQHSQVLNGLIHSCSKIEAELTYLRVVFFIHDLCPVLDFAGPLVLHFVLSIHGLNKRMFQTILTVTKKRNLSRTSQLLSEALSMEKLP